jgi:hypothetical protein
MAKAKQQSGEPSWRWRRILIYATLIWACYQLFTLIDAEDTRLNESLAWGWQVIVMVLVTGYTGFATAQDIAAILTTRTAKPYAEPPQEPTPAPAETVVVVQPEAKE